MIIKEHGMGWIIEPVTSDQRQALEKVIEGLRLLCPNESTVGGSDLAHPYPHLTAEQIMSLSPDMQGLGDLSEEHVVFHGQDSTLQK